MPTLVVASTRDLAAKKIASKLIERYSFEETDMEYEGRRVLRSDDVLLTYVGVEGIYAEALDRAFAVERVIFASRHRSGSGKPSLTVHVTGNPTSEAPFGGSPRSLAKAEPSRMKAALKRMKALVEERGLRYDVCLEATHHGPSEMSVPVIFVEIGSSEQEWKDEVAAEVAAEGVWAAATAPVNSKEAFGLGGGHYCPKHTRVTMEEDLAVGHVLPKYFFQDFRADIIDQAFLKTLPRCMACILDWKGVPGEGRRKALQVLEGLGVEIVRT